MRIHHQPRRDRAMQCKVSCVTKLVLACALVGIVVIAPAAGQSPPQPPSHPGHQPVGSWLVTYDVQAFGIPIPILLSFGRDGVMIETDTPAPTPVGSLGVLILSNGHGAWVPAGGGEFAYLYRKLIYQQDGFTPFGTARTSATGTISPDGTQLRATLLIEFLDMDENVVLSAPGSAIGTRIQVQHQ